MITLKINEKKLIIIQNESNLVKIVLIHIPYMFFTFFSMYSLLGYQSLLPSNKIVIFILSFCCIISLKLRWKTKIYIDNEYIKIVSFLFKRKKMIKISEIIRIELCVDTINKEVNENKKESLYKIEIILMSEKIEICSSKYEEEIKVIREEIINFIEDMEYGKNI